MRLRVRYLYEPRVRSIIRRQLITTVQSDRMGGMLLGLDGVWFTFEPMLSIAPVPQTRAQFFPSRCDGRTDGACHILSKMEVGVQVSCHLFAISTGSCTKRHASRVAGRMRRYLTHKTLREPSYLRRLWPTRVIQ